MDEKRNHRKPRQTHETKTNRVEVAFVLTLSFSDPHDKATPNLETQMEMAYRHASDLR